MLRICWCVACALLAAVPCSAAGNEAPNLLVNGGFERGTAGWQPDADFQRQAAIWGVALSEPVTPAELAAFVAYWQAEGRLFHHVQWQQKLARSVQMNRAASGAQ